MVFIPQDEVSLSHLKKEFKGYSFHAFKSDLLAGLNVSLLTVPQALAYAFLAGLPAAFLLRYMLRSLQLFLALLAI